MEDGFSPTLALFISRAECNAICDLLSSKGIAIYGQPQWRVAEGLKGGVAILLWT
jgi:hypothetical protein